MTNCWVVYRTDNGTLLSIGRSAPDDVKPNTAVAELDYPDDSQMWDAATRVFVPRPADARVDRLQDILTNSDYLVIQTVYNRASAAEKTQIVDAFKKLLGNWRYRGANESVTIR